MSWFDDLTPEQKEERRLESVRIEKAIQSTLAYKISHNVELTEDQKQGLYNLVSAGCRANTKERLHRVIFNYGIHNNPGIYSRVSFCDNGRVDYCAGQDYTAEIRTVRECILSAW